jgi:hypothetical protein
LSYGPSGSIIVRKVFEELGGFSGKRYVGDTELWLSIAALFPVLELPPALVFWRRHDEQEYKYGSNNINEGYFLMDLPLLEEKLRNELCPLTKQEADQIIKKHKKALSRTLVKYVIRSGNVKNALQKAKLLKLSVNDLF